MSLYIWGMACASIIRMVTDAVLAAFLLLKDNGQSSGSGMRKEDGKVGVAVGGT